MPFWSRKACKWLRTTASVSDGLMSMVDFLLFEVSVSKSADTRPQRPQVRAQELQGRSDDGAPRKSLTCQGAGYNMAQAAPRRCPRSRRQLIACPRLVGRQVRGLP